MWAARVLINLPSTNSAAQGRAERWEWVDAPSTDQLANSMSTPILLAQAVDKLPLTNSAAQGRAERGAVVRLNGCFLVGESSIVGSNAPETVNKRIYAAGVK